MPFFSCCVMGMLLSSLYQSKSNSCKEIFMDKKVIFCQNVSSILAIFGGSNFCIYILTAENLGVCFSYFLENYAMDFSQTLPFSSLYCSQAYKQKIQNVLLLLLGYKVRNLSKFTCFCPNLWPFLVHFSPFFCARHPTQLRKAQR